MKLIMLVMVGLMLAGCGSGGGNSGPTFDSHVHPGVHNSPKLSGEWYQSDDKLHIGGEFKFNSDGLQMASGNNAIYDMAGEYWLDGDVLYYHLRDFKGADIFAITRDDSAILTINPDGVTMTLSATATTKNASFYPLQYTKWTLPR